MNIVVTGCCGFIGAKVAEVLLRQGNTVYGIDNMNDAYDRRLKEWRLHQLRKNGNFIYSVVDITNGDELSSFFTQLTENVNGGGNVQGVINLAARAGVRRSIDEPALYYSTNLCGVLNLLEQCREHGIYKIVQASTSSVYGENELPFSEDQKTDRQLSPYASSKKSAELLCYTYHSLYNLDITVLRYFTVYGPAGRPDMSPFRFIKWAVEGEDINIYGDGNQSRDFTYVDDIATGTVKGLRKTGYQIINLGSDSPVKLNSFLGMIMEYTNSRSKTVYHPVNPADVRATWADISKSREMLGWEPAVGLEKGIRNSVEWYIANREWTREIIL